jgi:hypothetical protein
VDPRAVERLEAEVEAAELERPATVDTRA